MSATPFGSDRMIPDGPLHPTDAMLALGMGFGVAHLARTVPGVRAQLVLLATVTVLAVRQGDVVVTAWTQRPAPWLVTFGLATSLLLARAHVRRRRPPTVRVAAAVLAALAVVWAMVPDTEAALIAAGVLVGSLATVSGRGRTRRAGLLVALPYGAAVVGSIGRPATLGPALLVATLAGLTCYVVASACGAASTRAASTGRAGTPATVAPGSTSSRTTAPAPTLAS